MPHASTTFVTAEQINEIVEAKHASANQSPMDGAHLLRLAADTLDRAKPESVANLSLAHRLASWANYLERTADRDATCECGNLRASCVCDQQAAEHYLATRDATRLVGLGWPRDVLGALDGGEITPADLLEAEWRTAYQKGATPVEVRSQRM
jgi:hypothetical protein